MKRLLALVLIMTMFLTLGAVPALADELPEGEEPEVLLLGVAGWDISGSWTFAFPPEGDAPSMPATLSLTTEDPGAGEVSGDASGEVSGDDVNLTYTNGDYSVTLDGDITATTMSGTWSDSLGANGDWSATGTAVQLVLAPIEGFAWLAPVRLEGKPVHVGGNLTIKFRYGTPAPDEIEEPEDPEVEAEEIEGEVEEEIPEADVPIPTAELKIYLGDGQIEIISPKRCGDSGIWLTHFRPEAAGDYRVEAYLDGVLMGSIGFTVSEKGPHGMGQAKGKAGEEQGQVTSRNLIKENNREKNKNK